MAGMGNDDFLLDARGAPTIAGWPESLKREDHAGLDLAGVIKGDQAADHGFFPNCQPHPVAILQRKTSLFIGKAKLSAPGPNCAHPRRSPALPPKLDGGLQLLTAPL